MPGRPRLVQDRVAGWLVVRSIDFWRDCFTLFVGLNPRQHQAHSIPTIPHEILYSQRSPELDKVGRNLGIAFEVKEFDPSPDWFDEYRAGVLKSLT
ncbi:MULTISPECIES: hypothetical protein [Rhodococcus]|uniref:Uncharacterized protein n=2 Tax=Rhodococcus erythropolis group TaxID=2840174 RepID=A0AB38R7X0_RHOSG|nr:MULTISPECIES: hypothetical protein [Rhodococcus]MCD2131441.1 hypothetical protein [Rhodococcus qingshengii]UPU40859.1 hypothetical protein M0639_17435 [Rhodococcus qingshengii JCM 15477]